MTVRIDVIDSSRRDNGFLEDQRRMHHNPVLCSDLPTMVVGVIERAGGQTIERLRIFGHGRGGVQAVGGGTRPQLHQLIAVNSEGNLYNAYLLSMLCGCFAESALVQLHGCRVARDWRGTLLVYHLANLWRVRVQAAYDRQFADRIDRFEGAKFIEADGTPGSPTPLLVHPAR
jgi:hypothetical protein